MGAETPIFVRGYSRSGGTLLVTLLDAHPNVAMSYELYPNLLATWDHTATDLKALADVLADSKSLQHAVKLLEDRNLRTFLLRLPRGGLNHRDAAMLFEAHLRDGQTLADLNGRLTFLKRCCLERMNREGKALWGAKCSGRYDDYLQMWPGARFLDVVRDGRDVLASQLHTGSFNKSPEEIGRGWTNTHAQFQKLMKRAGTRARMVRYENLVRTPDQEISAICAFLELPSDGEMINFYRRDLPIFRTAHLSVDRITKPVDDSRVGRWRTEVTSEQLERFYSTAGDAMKELGYPDQNNADRPA